MNKAGYGVLFVVVLPALLIAWARAIESAVPIPVPLPQAAAFGLVIGGAILLLAGMIALWRSGGGLPMNAFPPPRYVAGGVYRWLAHPIYTGFSMLAAGVAVGTASPSGFWLVTPVVILGCVALVLGYERPDLEARFGPGLPLRPAGVVLRACWRLLRLVWEPLRRGAESIANSWREWQRGGVRLLNHGAYAGASAFVGLTIVGALAGSGSTTPMLVTAASSLIAAGLWAQFIEGSPQLLRPFGYYGGVLGVAAGAMAAPLSGVSLWLMLGAFAVAGPWIQAGGRLRCLVQGCCHGRPASERVGIRYRHPKSRVCRLTEWRDLPLHPTPLYSILWNCAAGAVLAWLWSVRAPLSLVAGLYLVLNGLGRFVEEAYRGEPQTASFAGLRLYQWLAVTSVLAGATLTAWEAPPCPAPVWRWGLLAPSLAFGGIVWFALGVDFPNSQQRFSRLA